MKRTLSTVVLTLAAALLIGLAAAVWVVRAGLYDVSAVTSHTQPVYTLLSTALKAAVARRAADIETPPLDDPALVLRGAACYRANCVQCHGAPGVAPGSVGMSLQPLPGPLVDASMHWKARELYWITRNGIRMSGMPAWQLRLDDGELWATVAFIAHMPKLSPQAYHAMVAPIPAGQCQASAGPRTDRSPALVAALDAAHTPPPAESRAALVELTFQQYACTSCHVVPGMTGPDTRVGPPLDGYARRTLVAGRLPNTVDDLVRWLRAPQQVKPGSAMPDLGVTEAHARLMAGYLLTFH